MPPRRRPLQKPKATIGYLANLDTSSSKTSHVGKEVVDRVRKCFARANHEHANEQEARAASRMASKIMEQHQITQADIMAEEDSSERAKRGGMSTVNIRPAKDGGRAFTPGWVDWLCGAMQNFFECRAFSTGYYEKIEWTFYGVAEHTVSAAIAFEAVHNQIQDWSERFTGIPIRNSYCLGVADGLLRLSKEEQRATEDKIRQNEANALAARIKEEELEGQKRLAKLRNPPTEPIKERLPEESKVMQVDDDPNAGDTDYPNDPLGDVSDNEVLPDFHESYRDEPTTVNTQADFDAELRKFIPAYPPAASRKRTEYSSDSETVQGDDNSALSPKEEGDDEASLTQDGDGSTIQSTEKGEGEPDSVEETAEWKSMRQLMTFREMSKDIEDQVLKDNNFKLRKRRKRSKQVKDRNAFMQGRMDSKKIEVRAARIEHEADSQMDEMDLDD